MKILFLSRWFPYPPDNGSKLRIFNLIRQLALQHEVNLISFIDEAIVNTSLEKLGEYCGNIYTSIYQPFQQRRLKSVLGFFSKQPRSIVDTHSRKMAQLVNQVEKSHKFDLVIASQLEMVVYANQLTDIPKILEEVELSVFFDQFMNEQSLPIRFRRGLMWWKLSNFLKGILGTFNGCTVVSENEKRLLSNILKNDFPIEIIPNGVDTNSYAFNQGAIEQNSLIYSGSLTYYANYDAVEYFLREIFPIIQARNPRAKLYVTGDTKNVQLDKLPQRERVEFTGYLADVKPRIAQSAINIVPLRIGGGTRLKILESLALGTPVVATNKGAEGLDLKPGRDLLIGDTPNEFAESVLNILDNNSLREELSDNGRREVVNKYEWHVIGKRFNEFLEAIVSVS